MYYILTKSLNILNVPSPMFTKVSLGGALRGGAGFAEIISKGSVTGRPIPYSHQALLRFQILKARNPEILTRGTLGPEAKKFLTTRKAMALGSGCGSYTV